MDTQRSSETAECYEIPTSELIMVVPLPGQKSDEFVYNKYQMPQSTAAYEKVDAFFMADDYDGLREYLSAERAVKIEG